MAFLKIKELPHPEIEGFNLEYLDKPSAVACLLFDQNYKQVLLVNQFRVGCKSKIWEIPAGVIDENEDPKDAILREISEETGYSKDGISDLKLLTEYYPSVGYSNEKLYIYSARLNGDLNKLKGEQQLDEHEKIEIKWFDFNEVDNLVFDGKSKIAINEMKKIPKQKIGLFGGTFNPITYLHLLTMERAIEEFDLDKCLIEPVNNKYGKREIIDSKYRCKMIKNAIKDNDKMELGTYEINQFLQPPTFETLHYYKNKYGWCDIYFICGSDLLKEMLKWSRVNKLLNDFNIICVQRDNDNIYKDIILKNDILVKHKNKIHIVYENVTNNVSSSAVRNLVKNNMSIKYLVPNEVEKYILDNKLYKGE